MTDTTHLIGLLLGTEEDWPTAFETLVSRLGEIAVYIGPAEASSVNLAAE